jgi:O-antigen/teichoic acid export membrane protein
MLRWLYSKGFFHLLSVNFALKFLAFVSVLLLAKLLTAVEIGQLRILQNYAGLFGILAAFGYNTAVLKFCAENRSETELAGILRLSFERSGIAALLTMALMVVLSLLGFITASASLGGWLALFSLTIPFGVWSGLLVTYLQARKRIADMARSQTIVRLQAFALVVTATWLWGFEGCIIAFIVTGMLATLPLFHQVGWRFLLAPRVRAPIGFTQMAFFASLATGVANLANTADIILLDHLVADRTAIGYYSLAMLFVMAADQFTGTVQAIVTPYFSANYRNESWVHEQLRRNQLRLLGLSVVVALACFAGAYVLVKLLYGPAYMPVLTFLAILLLKYVIVSSYSVMGPVLLAMGQTKYNFAVVAVTTPIALGLGYVMVSRYAMYGAAWGQVILALINLPLQMWTTRYALRSHFRSLAAAL